MSENTRTEGHEWANRLTRTQWLLVLALGVIVWVVGYITTEPILAVPGFFVALFAALSAWHTNRKA